MPVEFASASGGEPAKEPDFVTIDEAGLPARVVGACERPDEGIITGSAGRALRAVGTDIFVRTLMRTAERTDTTAELLELKKTLGNWRFQETMRVCEAYRATDKVDDPQSRSPHRIDMIA